MFTGIVEELGAVLAVEPLADAARIRIRGPRIAADLGHGDSVAVNGVCLTVVDHADGEFSADVMAETLRRSNLGTLAPGSAVNLERPLALGGRLDGHLVQGHVDGTAVITGREPAPHWEVVRFTLPQAISRYVVEKGSIAVDGISLTVVEVTADAFAVSLIPTTLELTTLGRKRKGDAVNIEVDPIAKYVERLLGARV